MNTVLDVLLLRRPVLNYVSPPVCPVLISGSGSSLMVEAVETPAAPQGVSFAGQCNKFVVWASYPGLVCMSLYKEGTGGRLTQIAECVPSGYVGVCSPGWFRITTSDLEGNESDPGQTVFSPGDQTVFIPVPKNPGAVRFNVYKNPDPLDVNGNFFQVLSTISTGAIEACAAEGCYRVQAITEDGISGFSDPVCRENFEGCCPPEPCSGNGYGWSLDLCSCVLGIASIFGPSQPYCIGEVYTSTLTASGGLGPYTWTLLSGSVPTGLTLHLGTFGVPTIALDGTPTDAGPFSFQVRVVDSTGSSAQATFTMNSAGVLQYPSLPDAVTDTAYSEQLSGMGGTGPYTFSIVSGSLPDGFSMTSGGLVTGTGFIPDSGIFTVRTTDSLGASCDTPLLLSVVGCPVPSTFPTIPYWGL